VSEVDTRFDAAERAQLLDEVRDYLPAFLSAASTQQYDPVGDVRELLRLDDVDLRRVIAVHLCLTDPVKAFFQALPQGLRRPMASSTRPAVVSQAVRGPIDWGATIRTRAMSAGDPSLFVVRPARRIFDIPENRALAWLLQRLDSYLRRAASSAVAAEYDEEAARWAQQLAGYRSRLLLTRRHPWLREVQAERPSAATLRRLRAARTAFYARHIPDAVLTVMRYGEHPTENELTELLTQRYFRPTEDWRLFEVVVALRLARAFAERSPEKRRARLLVGTSGAAYARYVLDDGDEVRLHYQSWPPSAGASLHAQARDRHQLKAGPSRPDLFIARMGKAPDAAVLELKATRSGGYLGEGLSQLLGYVKERSGAWTRNPSGWLVAPASTAYVAAEPTNAEVWMVSADDVAQAAVDRFASS
jgi:hypothetical protein